MRIQLGVDLLGRVKHGIAELIAADNQEFACGGDAFAHDELVEAGENHAGLCRVVRTDGKGDFLKGKGAAHVVAAVLCVVQHKLAARDGDHAAMRGLDERFVHRIGVGNDDFAAVLHGIDGCRKVAERRLRRRTVTGAAVA